MKMTTILYDNNGKIWLTVDGRSEAPIINSIAVEVPSDKKVVGIDRSVVPNQPILADKTDSPEYLIQELTKRVNSLESSQNDQDDAIIEMSETIYGG